MTSAGTHGAVTWVDLSTPDIDGAVRFYRDLLGWTDVSQADTPTGMYHMGKVGDRAVCGMMGQGPELADRPATWTTFFYVDDVDAAAGHADQLGGRVLTPPFDIPDARIAVIGDPTGAMFGIFGGPSIEGEYFSTEPGAVCWVELLTRDVATAEIFYSGLFGWGVETSASTGYTVYKLGDDMAAGMLPMPDAVPAAAPAHWSVYFAVVDCAETETRAKELGGSVLVPTMTIEMGKFAVLADPAGAKFDIMEFAG